MKPFGRRWKPVAIATLLVVGLVAAACGGNGGDSGDSDGDGGDGGNGANGDAVTEITVQALPAIAFEPEELTVTVNEPVRIIFENTGSQLHDFTVPDLPASDVQTEGGADHEAEGEHEQADVHIAAEAGETATLTFTPTEAGEYEFRCTVDNHAELGMVGTLVVEE